MKQKEKNSHPMLRLSKNFYFLIGIIFLVWMIFFDGNSLINQYQLNAKYHELQGQEKFYSEEIEELQIVMDELSSDPEKLEKFAREKYLFKRRGEDVYIIEKKDED